MKIAKVAISNFGSIANQTIGDFGNLNIFVGRNGTGKSFFLQAIELFITEIQAIGGSSSILDDQYFWHNRNDGIPIRIGVDFSISKDEREQAYEFLLATSPYRSGDFEPDENRLVINRALFFGSGWKTELLAINGDPIVENDRHVDEQQEEFQLELSRWILYLFSLEATENNIVGNRYLVNVDQGIAYHSNPQLDSVVSDYGLQVDVSTKGQDPATWAADQGLEVVARVPNNTEASLLFSLTENENEKTTSELFRNLIQSQFTLLPPSRDSRESDEFRTDFVDSALAKRIKDVSISVKLIDEEIWRTFNSHSETILEKRLEPNPENLLVRNSNLRLPMKYGGGGEQTVMSIIWHLCSEEPILALEEPEIHLHPHFEKKMMELLREISKEKQLFISTHSPLMVDKQSVTSNFLVRNDGMQATYTQCETVDDLRAILVDLGVVPSDMLFKDLVVFVEGGTEKIGVFPIWAETLDLNLADNMAVGLINIGGERRLKSNLRIWLEVASEAPTDFLIVLDGHSHDTASQIQDEMNIDASKFLYLERHAIEDYYPPKLIVEGLDALFGINVDSKEVRHQDGKSRATTIKEILQKHNKIKSGWKVLLGQFVATRMTKSTIPDDFKKIVARIKKEV